jgi:SEC-C motif-containing protein
LLTEQSTAATALELMRSRYVAFAEQNGRYLLKSWHPQTRPGSLEFNPDQRWIGLKILNTVAGTERDSEGCVEFIARYKIGGRGYRLHEISRFVRVKDKWRYRNGERGSKDSG